MQSLHRRMPRAWRQRHLPISFGLGWRKSCTHLWTSRKLGPVPPDHLLQCGEENFQQCLEHKLALQVRVGFDLLWPSRIIQFPRTFVVHILRSFPWLQLFVRPVLAICHLPHRSVPLPDGNGPLRRQLCLVWRRDRLRAEYYLKWGLDLLQRHVHRLLSPLAWKQRFPEVLPIDLFQPSHRGYIRKWSDRNLT